MKIKMSKFFITLSLATFSMAFAEQTLPNAVSQPTDTIRWELSGQATLQLGYHLVRTSHNYSGNDYIWGTDTIKKGDRYENYSQVPGLFGNANTYMVMQSNDGRTLEFEADLSSDSWNRFYAHTVRTTYTDSLQKISIGDNYLTGKETYLAGVNALGGLYSLYLLRNNANAPLFTLTAFGGETQAPLHIGDKNPLIYKDYAKNGEANAQSLLVGGSVQWAPLKRFDMTLGFIGSKDYLKDPLLRDGMSKNTNTAEPLKSSKTFFADAKWQIMENMTLNTEFALGGADTTNVLLARAVNQVFADAGLSVSNFALLRQLMQNPNRIATLSREELLEIFDDYSTLSPSEMRNELRRLIQKAKTVQNQYEHQETSQADVTNFDGQNLALAISLNWTFAKTAIEAKIKFIGDDYYSAGSPDQLSDTRSLALTLKQDISDFWKLALHYDLNIENASNENKYNIFGFGEGTTWGLFPDKNSSWFDIHEQDNDRTYYIHKAALKNEFLLGKLARINVRYAIDYRTRNRPNRLYANYSVESGIYEDPWFAPQKKATIPIVSGNDTLEIDSARWTKYYGLINEPYLASRFEERLLKHTVSATVSFKIPHNEISVGGVWTYRDDLSEFERDSLLDGFDFKDETYGILGYSFNGLNYFEQSYPVKIRTNAWIFENNLLFTPRFKYYNKDSMREYEWFVSDALETEISKDFITLILEGSFRHNVYKRNDNDNRLREVEMDTEGTVTLRSYFTQALYTDWTLGAYYYYRPDHRADGYKDFLLAAAVHYEF